MAGEVIVGYDGSECAKGALSQAVDQARAFGTDLVIASLQPTPQGLRCDQGTPEDRGKRDEERYARRGRESRPPPPGRPAGRGLLALARAQASMILTPPARTAGFRRTAERRWSHSNLVGSCFVVTAGVAPGLTWPQQR